MHRGVDCRLARRLTLQISIFVEQFRDEHNQPTPNTVGPAAQDYC